MFGMSLLATILSGIGIWFVGFLITWSAFLAIEKKKYSDSWTELLSVFFFWILYVVVSICKLIGTVIGKFVLFVEGK